MIKRSNFFKLLCSSFLFALIIKIYFISVVNGEKYLAIANKQNYLNINVTNNRNNISDRNGKMITGIEKETFIILFSTNDNKKDFEFAKLLSKYSDENEYVIYNSLFKKKFCVLKSQNNKDINKLKKYNNIIITEKEARYLSDFPSVALIGYLKDGSGASGLEKVYDDILQKTETDFSILRDTKNNLYGIAEKNKKTKITLKTTINLDYQRICDDVLKEYNMPSGAVLLSVPDFQVLSMTSYPSFNPENISESLNKNDGSLNNRCLQQYDMGSIFKIVVMAAALESGLSSENFIYQCDGASWVHDQKFECHNIYGHGIQNMEQSFMNSCNPAFIEIGTTIGIEKILKMAEDFGFNRKNLTPYELGYTTCKLPDKDNYYMSDLANISIGQGTLSCNVVQGAVLSAIIASGGVFQCPATILGISVDGKFIKNKSENIAKRVISKATSDKIKNMMIETCINGTGTTGQIDFFGSGGKTGSAQTGWIVNDELYQHAWFTGFFPAENPKFALCVLVENGKSGSETAAPIFKKIGERIMKITR